MVDAILLILREVLEASLILTLLVILSRKLGTNLHWILPSIILGALLSWALAHYAYAIADAFDGAGQEWTNSLLYLIVILSFMMIAWIISPSLFDTHQSINKVTPPQKSVLLQRSWLIVCMTITVALSLAREVAEIWIYLGGFIDQPNRLQPALIGGVIGLGIGASLGVITYYLLTVLSTRAYVRFLFIFLVFFCGGLSTQIARQLMQIGVLDSPEPLWDASNIINERSWVGELLYGFFGYDASPNSAQIIFYLLAAFPLLFIAFWHWIIRRRMHA